MSKTGSLITNMQKYATRPEWKSLFGEVIREHMEHAAEALDVDPADISDIVGDQSGEFIATVFEDFATRRRADGTCMAADYLKRAGWRESGYARLRKADSSADPMPSLSTTAWIAWLNAGKFAPRPQVVNRDGDELLLSKSRLPLLARAEEIAAIMNTLPGWEPASDNHLRWVWLASGEAPDVTPKARKKSQPGSPAGTLLGDAVIERKHLVFATNSRQRMERGLLMLQEALRDKVGPALISYEEMDLNAVPVPDGGAAPAAMPSPEGQHDMILAILDRHYRETIRMPIPALGNKTPAQAVKTKAGRERTIAWLKDLERSTAHGAMQRGMPAYNFGWMWEELGLSRDR